MPTRGAQSIRLFGGSLDVDPAARCVLWVAPSGEVERFEDHPLAKGMGVVDVASAPDSVHALLAPRAAEVFYLFDLEERRLSAIPFGERLPANAQMSIHVLDDVFVVVAETGVLVLSHAGSERWRIDRVTYNWSFVGDADGYLWFSDSDDNLLSFHPQTGDEGPL